MWGSRSRVRICNAADTSDTFPAPGKALRGEAFSSFPIGSLSIYQTRQGTSRVGMHTGVYTLVVCRGKQVCGGGIRGRPTVARGALVRWSSSTGYLM